MSAKSDYYDILEVSKNASSDEIKKAYRKQALEWHPDRHKGADKEVAEKKFKEINEAYQVLFDSQKRNSYDQFGHDAFVPGGMPGESGGPGRPFTYYYSSGGGSPSSQGFNFDFGDPFDIFEQFFGGSPFGRARPQKPRYSIIVDFMDAVKGVTKEVVIGGKRRKIKIPAGIDEGTRVNFDDFILSVNIKPDSIFEREGADIYTSVEIPYSMAVLGGEVDVPTIDGNLSIRVRAGTRPGTMVRLRGKGVQLLRGRGMGDEYVRLLISVPEKLTKEQRDLVNKMDEVNL